MIPDRIRFRTVIVHAVLLVALTVFTATGCMKSKGGDTPQKPPLIGFSMDSLVVERWKRDLDIFSQSLKELGADMLLEVAGEDPVLQEVQVRSLLDRGIDCLVIVPNDADRLSAVVVEAKARGVAVLCYDRLVRRAGSDLYISFDNEKVGYLMAEAVAKALPKAEFVIVNGARSDNNAIMLNRGMRSVIDPRIADGTARIVSEIWPVSWNNEEVRKQFEIVLSTGRKINAVIAGNDMLAEAVINVLSENRLTGKVLVAGQDADLAACQRIAEGIQFATIYKPIDRLALKAAGFAVMLARGEHVTADSTINDGSGEVPYVRLEPILVTRDRLMTTVIKDGFHAAKDVFRNVHP